ncbi:unnamed protein product [Oncorhynchus mykiss]|uniref:TNFR-Cys domain-containing protein n=1 Tax=Oncorhynchus mykiss TaxID=8022 RepID=A0A060YXP4_ONCMY|nr:unnamed protein product [Oncorhynchus mykiss]
MHNQASAVRLGSAQLSSMKRTFVRPLMWSMCQLFLVGLCKYILPLFSGEYLSRHGKCHLCYATCYKCVGPEKEDCISCPSSRYFEDGQCVIRCQGGRYAMERQCHLCHHTCQECDDGGPDNCTSCDKDKFQTDRYHYRGECRDVCPEGFFHSWRKRCEVCSVNCTVCTDFDRCLHCSPSHYLRDGLCVPLECGEGETPHQVHSTCSLLSPPDPHF